MEIMKRNPLLSVIVPFYNSAIYLRQCLQSISCQTYQNLEIILVEDGVSMDGSTDICREFLAMDTRIKMIRIPHGGPSCARKAGILISQGEYVTCVDSDDWIDIDTYENLFISMGEQSPDVLLYGFIREYANNRGVICQYALPSGYYDKHRIVSEIDPKLLELHYPDQWELLPKHGEAGREKCGPKRQMQQTKIHAGVWSKLAKRDIFKRSQMLVPDNLTNGEDLVCTVHLLRLANSVLVDMTAPYHYRMREDSIARTVRYEQYQLLFDTLYLALQQYPLFNIYLVRLCQLMLSKILLSRYDFFLESPLSGLLFGNLEKCRVALYGAGKFGQEIYKKTASVFPERITLWVDQNYKLYQEAQLPVRPVEELLKQEYDVIILALVNEMTCEEIKRNLTAMGIAPDKIRYATASPEVLDAVKAILIQS